MAGARSILVLAVQFMLLFFRSLFGSKLGVIVTLTFIAILGVAFALGSVSGSSFGGFSSGSKIASVGSEKISATDLETQFSSIVKRLRQRNPQLSIKEFLAQDGLNDVLTYVMDGKAVMQWGDQHGIYVGDRLIDSEIAKDPNIQAPDGKVDSALYRQLLAQQGTSDSAFRTEQTQTLMAKLLLASNSFGLKVPRTMTGHYYAVLTEHRRGAIVTLPPAAFAPAGPPSDAEVTGWYNGHKADYILPERRTVRFVSYTDAAVKASAVPTDAEITARYTENKAKYAASDKRKLSQMVLSNEAAARQVVAEVAGGKPLEASAQAKGLAVAALGTLTKDGYALQSSAEAASAVYAAPNAKVLGPFKAPLGWIVVRVDGRETTAGQTLDQAKPELVKELTDEKRRLRSRTSAPGSNRNLITARPWATWPKS
jgi:peptidyl-prolyl cis-trans isomerase D